MKIISSNRKSHMEQTLNKLSSIKKVETSAFLFHRIQQKIDSKGNNDISTKWFYTLAASVLILLSLNVFVVVKSKKKEAAITVAKSMHLLNNENFYNVQ